MTNRTPEAAPSDSDDGADCAGQPVLEISEARRGTIGGALEVRRALPGKPRRMVGAWCFLDHAGPLDYAPGEGLAVGPHPHIGLQTFTWMIEGEIEHLDSLGYRQMLRPGQVNLMTAGRGISHAEVSPTDRAGRVHTAQLWIALPDQARHIEPSFEHHPQLPQVQCDGFTCTVLVGEALGEVAPPRVYSPMVGIDTRCEAAARTSLPLEPSFEHALMCLEGAVDVAGQRIVPGQLLYLGMQREALDIASDAPMRLLLIGGEPFGEEVLLWWNFVARTQEELQEATREWNSGDAFGEVAGTDLPRLRAPALDGVTLRAS